MIKKHLKMSVTLPLFEKVLFFWYSYSHFNITNFFNCSVQNAAM